MMELRKQIACVLAGALLGSQALAEDDCTLAAEYFAQAEAAAAQFNDETRVRSLQRAAESCPRADYWFALGDAIVDVGESSAPWLGIPSDAPEGTYAQYATQAYSHANRLAESSEENIAAILAWSRVAFYEMGNWDAAVAELRSAEEQYPGNADILALKEEVLAYNPNSEEEILRAFRDSVRAQPASLAEASNLVADDVPQPTGGITLKPVEPEVIAAAPVSRSVSQNIVFLSGSTEVEDVSLADVRLLATALATEEMAGKRFTIVGHADERGDNYSNLTLSQARARAIERQLVLLEPSLSGRIASEGIGELRPRIAGARSESEHRANRRIEVLVN